MSLSIAARAVAPPSASASCALQRRPGLRGALLLCRRPLPRRPRAAAPVAISAAQKKVFSSFSDMINGSTEPVLVEFYATWCGPCQMMGQILDEVAPALKNRVRFVKVDSEKYSSLASQYQIGALPTLVLFKGGRPVDRIEGVIMPPDLKARLEYQLAAK